MLSPLAQECWDQAKKTRGAQTRLLENSIEYYIHHFPSTLTELTSEHDSSERVIEYHLNHGHGTQFEMKLIIKLLTQIAESQGLPIDQIAKELGAKKDIHESEC